MKTYWLIVLLFIIASCKPQLQEANDTNVDLPMDFQIFLEQFHSDSLYQINHINFPLQGIPTMMDSLYDASGYHWAKGDWVMHKGFDANEEFEQSFTLFTENMITEKITHISGKIEMERRFAKLDDEWHLIYYAAMNFIKQE